MRLLSTAATAILFAALPLVATAQNEQPSLSQRFAAANVTNNGCLTQAQAVQGRLVWVAREFQLIDATRRGCVTLQEIGVFWHRARVQQQSGASASQ
jgi:hypothetical protein